ncbi:hypothetical protein N0V83_010870 [Neocucurbitaria cava]|uniref:Serine hydrolase domain-containing protein n=1 Tax=Neocucurbitaria cava TaxID=798079 RepID=A0A9W8Y069_9PLEO|nr:hypothetical protein N0V83_010870 [Neocucurbitaria cava]
MAAPHPNSTYMSPSTPPKGAGSGEPIKPTLLAFHGSGSNATVHTVQLARLMRAIKPYFNVESLEAPFPSPAGPGVLPFFDGCGPFKRWLPPTEKVSIESMRSGTSTSTLSPEVESLVRSTIQKIRSEGGGRVVGLIGFSQGTKVVAGLLKGCEIRRALLASSASSPSSEDLEDSSWLDFDFALSVCGSYPPPLIPSCATDLLAKSTALGSEQEKKELLEGKIGIPTFHVQGSRMSGFGRGGR